MSLFSVVVFVIIILLNSIKSEVQNEKPVNVTSSMQNIKEFMTKMVKDQSTKIQTLLKKIQYNAQTVLTKIRNMNQIPKPVNDRRNELKKQIDDADDQIESPIPEDNRINDVSTELAARSFSNHYVSTGFGASGNANYGVSTYHHHSIGFDPINIVLSMSLLSLLLQALQGFLGRPRLPTPIVEARRLDSITSTPTINWDKNNFEEKKPGVSKKDYYLKKKLFKKALN